MMDKEHFEALKANVNYENIRQEYLEQARTLANQSHVRPVEDFFYFGTVVDGHSVRLFYEWKEVWPKSKLKAFNDRTAASMKSAAERVERDLEGVSGENPDVDEPVTDKESPGEEPSA